MAKKQAAAAPAAQTTPAGYVPALKKLYKEEIIAKLQKQFGYSTVMQVPKLVKITINEGIGDATGDKKRGSAGTFRHHRPEGYRDHFQKGYLQLQTP